MMDVDYSYNKISHVEGDAFVGVNTIKKLNLSHNHIIEMPQHRKIVSEHFYESFQFGYCEFIVQQHR